MMSATDARFRTFTSHRDYVQQQYTPLTPWNWSRQLSPPTQSPFMSGFSLPAPTPLYPSSPYTAAWMQAQALKYSQMHQWMAGPVNTSQQGANTAGSVLPQSNIVAVNQ